MSTFAARHHAVVSTGTTGPAFRPMSTVSMERQQQQRRSRVLPALLVVLVVVVFGGTAIFLSRFRPVELGSTFAVGRFAKVDRGGRLPSGPVRLRFVEGKGTSFGLSLRNGGRLTIKVEDVKIVGGGSIVRQTKVRLPLTEDSRSVVPDETRRFRTVGLDPGEEQFVVVVLRFGKRCPADTVGLVDGLKLDYSVFELPKEMRVGLREPLEIPCPASSR